MKYKKLITTTLLTSMLFLMNCKMGDSSPWIWKIDGGKLTVNQLESAYAGYFFLMAQQFQTTPEQLKKYLANPEKVGRPDMINVLRQLQVELDKKNFSEKYKQLMLLNKEAKKNKFLDQNNLKSKLAFLKQYFIANMYLSQTMNAESVEISDEEAIEEWEAIKKRDRRAKTVPIDQGIEIARNQIKLRTMQLKQQNFLKKVSESYKIETNPNFKLEDYLKADKKQKEASTKDAKSSKDSKANKKSK